MKIKCLTYLLSLVVIFGLFFVSCDSDGGSDIQEIEGHWVYLGTKADVYVIDAALQRKVEEYIQKKNEADKLSYEFKNDRTYYFYQNLAIPMKGIVKNLGEDSYLIDDARGLRTLSYGDSVIYVVSDLKEEIVRELQIDERMLVKALAVDTFRRGLFED